MTIQEFISFLIEATPEQQTMYRELTMKLHPDRQGNQELMKQLNAAKDNNDWSAIENLYRKIIGKHPKPKPKEKRQHTPDFVVKNEGSIFILRPVSTAAKDWANEHIPEDATHFGGGIVVEHRYIQDIIDGIKGDGLTVTVY